MRNYYLWLFVTVMLLGASSLKSAEIIPVWNKTLGEGSIQDMQLMPGGNEFMLTTSKGEIQIRSSENGELVRSHIDTTNLFMNGYFEFTPDSNRVVMGISGLLQIIDINTFERLKYFALGPDTVARGFSGIAIDPIRPYVYVTLKGWETTSGQDHPRSKVQVYNYETMKLVKDLTPYGEYNYTAIAVSDDGKYLATLNNGKAYLKVWDLATMEQIRNVQLWDDKLPDNEYWCESSDIQFSKLNSDVIFYSGNYPSKTFNPNLDGGIHKFYVSTNVKTKNIQKDYYGGKFIFFDNENISLVYQPTTLYFYNFIDKTTDKYYKTPNIYSGGKILYSDKDNFFIGFENSYMFKFLYDRKTNVKLNYIEEIIISPNPTNSFVNIILNCNQPTINYQINDVNGLLLIQNTIPNQGNNLKIDFSIYPVGVYFLTLNCNNQPKTYKIIKEG